MKYILTSICLALVLGSCGTKEATTSPAATFKGAFNVVEVTGTNLGMIVPTILVNTKDSTLNGYAGCNNYRTTYTMTATSLSIQQIAMTKMACIQGMEQERKFAKAMAKVTRHTLENGKLTLFEDQTVLIKAESTTM